MDAIEKLMWLDYAHKGLALSMDFVCQSWTLTHIVYNEPAINTDMIDGG